MTLPGGIVEVPVCNYRKSWHQTWLMSFCVDVRACCC
jgi:hypothetical protein